MRLFPLLMLVTSPVLAIAATPEFKGSIERLDPALGLPDFIAPGAKIEVLASGFTWSEGPVWYDGGIVFSDVPKNIAYKWKEGDTAAAMFLNPSGATKVLTDQGSNGLVLDKQGRLILCQGGDRCVARLEKDGKFTPLAKEYKGRHFNSPNDVIIHSNGTLIFTDPPYGVPEGRGQEIDFHGVFVVTHSGQVLPLIKDVRFCNGQGLSPDEKTLYIAVSDPEPSPRRSASAARRSLPRPANRPEPVYRPRPGTRTGAGGLRRSRLKHGCAITGAWTTTEGTD